MPFMMPALRFCIVAEVQRRAGYLDAVRGQLRLYLVVQL